LLQVLRLLNMSERYPLESMVEGAFICGQRFYADGVTMQQG
jgi:hypothetical protein